MSFNLSALDPFRNANLAGETAIANVGKDGAVSQKGNYHGALGAIFRSSSTQAANNAARTELLRTLGDAFDLDGVGRNAKGVTTFSKDFMDKLAKLLGPAFKCDDFGVGADGTVSSGKPLTQRRISAIVTRALIASRGDYDAKVYKEKLALVNAELDKLGPDTLHVDSVKDYFAYASKCMDFLENEFEDLIQENPQWNERRAATDKDYDVPRFCFVKPGEFEGEPCKTRARFTNFIAYESSIKPVLHYEEYKNLPRELNTPEDVKALKNYVRNTIQTYIRTSIDLFLDAKDAGKLPQLMAKIDNKPGACMDAKASMPGIWREELGLLQHVDDMDTVATHDKDQPLHECIGRVIAAVTKENPSATSWADIAGAVKKQLVGIYRPMSTMQTITSTTKDGEEISEHKFGTLTGDTGKPVVRAITEEDIDALGEAVLDTILNG